MTNYLVRIQIGHGDGGSCHVLTREVLLSGCPRTEEWLKFDDAAVNWYEQQICRVVHDAKSGDAILHLRPVLEDCTDLVEINRECQKYMLEWGFSILRAPPK